MLQAVNVWRYDDDPAPVVNETVTIRASKTAGMQGARSRTVDVDVRLVALVDGVAIAALNRVLRQPYRDSGNRKERPMRFRAVSRIVLGCVWLLGPVSGLMVRALVLDDGRARLAIATCDRCVIPRDLIDQAKELAKRRTGIPVNRMLMAATHTHTAPTLTDLNPRVPRDPEYLKLVVEGLAQGVAQAAGRLVPARIGWGVASLPEEVNNRRWFMREELLGPNPFGGMDRVRMNPPAGSPDLVRPAGPTDPGVSVVSIQTADGKLLALLANYSLHYVGDVPPGTVSADYFGEFARQIGNRLNADGAFVAMLTNGTSGDSRCSAGYPR